MTLESAGFEENLLKKTQGEGLKNTISWSLTVLNQDTGEGREESEVVLQENRRVSLLHKGEMWSVPFLQVQGLKQMYLPDKTKMSNQRSKSSLFVD